MKGFEDISPDDAMIEGAGLQCSFNAMLDTDSDADVDDVSEWGNVLSHISVAHSLKALVSQSDKWLKAMQKEVVATAKLFVDAVFNRDSVEWARYLVTEYSINQQGVLEVPVQADAIQEFRSRNLQSRCEFILPKGFKLNSDEIASIEVYVRYRLRGHESVSMDRFSSTARLSFRRFYIGAAWLIDGIKMPGLA